ncbi:MAG: CoA ligase, partial [Geminicoccaceae bacterium]|nr:CoA ligase [Geminicoccaceae bacterium]
MTPETLNQRFHRSLYLGIQRLRGRPLGAYIRQLEQWERLEPRAFHALCSERLVATLEYAFQRVPLYQADQWSRRVGKPQDIRSWPVLERETVQARGSELLAQPTPPGLYYRSTSGSTGKPLRIGTDPDGAAWAWANDHRGLLWHGIRLGARSLTLRPRTESALAEWIRNRRAVPANEMSPEHLSDAVRFLQTHRPAYVWGYTSAVVELA